MPDMASQDMQEFNASKLNCESNRFFSFDDKLSPYSDVIQQFVIYLDRKSMCVPRVVHS